MTDRTSKTVTPARLRNVADWLMNGCDRGQAAVELRILAQDLESAGETSAERELFSQVGQLIAGWKQGCAPAEWSDFDEQVLRSWQAWRIAQMPSCPRDDLPSACGERFGPGDHHECRLQPNHDDACKCSCGAIRS